MATSSGTNNVYTVLTFIASMILLAGVVYVLVRYNAVFGGLPFTGTITLADLAPALPAMLPG